MSIEIIAEIGSSPARDGWRFDLWCAAASLAGATHVKAQMFFADSFPPSERASKKPLEFPRWRFDEFVDAAHRRKLKAGASVFDTPAAALVAEQGDFVKLAAREQDNSELILYVLRHGRPVYRSISDVRCMGYRDVVEATLFTIPSYPTGMARALVGVLRAALFFGQYPAGVRWGWSSHTRGWLDCRLAARLGATVLEKHLALRSDDVEAGWSLQPHEFARMVKEIRS